MQEARPCFAADSGSLVRSRRALRERKHAVRRRCRNTAVHNTRSKSSMTPLRAPFASSAS